MHLEERLLIGRVSRRESGLISRKLSLIQSYVVSTGKKVNLQVHKSISPSFINKFLSTKFYSVDVKDKYDLDYKRDYYTLTIGDDRAEADCTVIPKFNCTHKFKNEDMFAISTSTKICPICGRIIVDDEIRLLKYTDL